MRQPQDHSDPIEEALLAARAERPGEAARARTLAALGLGVAASTLASTAAASSVSSASSVATSTAATASSAAAPIALGASAAPLGAAGSAAGFLAKGWVAKAALGGALTLASAGAVWKSSTSTMPPSPAAVAAVASGGASTAPVPLSEPIPGLTAIDPTEPAPEAPVASAAPVASVAPEARHTGAPRASVAPAVAPSAEATASPSGAEALLEEQKALDRARVAIRGRDSAGAFAALNAYEKAYPRGKFAHEMPVLRLEALAIQNPEAARALARDYLERHPHGPLATRLRNAVGLPQEKP